MSWIRHEDLHILTVDKYKYSTNHRLSVEHDAASQEWLLKIQSVSQEDAGMYECQVSTKPLLSFIVSLEVVGKYYWGRGVLYESQVTPRCLSICQSSFYLTV